MKDDNSLNAIFFLILNAHLKQVETIKVLRYVTKSTQHFVYGELSMSITVFR